MDRMHQWTLSALRRVLRLRRWHVDPHPIQSVQHRHHQKRLRPHPQHQPHLARHHRESLVDLRVVSGPLFRMKDSRCAYLDYHSTLVLIGRLAFQPRRELGVPDAEGSAQSLYLRS
ncbi:hypothetical protein BDZ45DRAFT_454873 [Acephala macrosclerotiorum]|nr:hypothetical protein BDZ45DRAFT_454873 [Acephala macrosclerotiorum]